MRTISPTELWRAVAGVTGSKDRSDQYTYYGLSPLANINSGWPLMVILLSGRGPIKDQITIAANTASTYWAQVTAFGVVGSNLLDTGIRPALPTNGTVVGPFELLAPLTLE